MGAWYDSRTKQEVMNLLILKKLQQAVGSFGLTGLDKLLSFMIVKELQVWLYVIFVMFCLGCFVVVVLFFGPFKASSAQVID